MSLSPAQSGLGAQPPSWDGAARGAAGIHGVPRARRWDAVVTAVAPRLRGDAVHFIALPDGTLVVEEDEPSDSLTPLADAVDAALSAPYRAEAVRRDREVWAVAASRIAVVHAPGLEGEEIELTMVGGRQTLVADGGPTLQPASELARLGEAEGRDYVVRARRLDDELWQVDAAAL